MANRVPSRALRATIRAADVVALGIWVRAEGQDVDRDAQTLADMHGAFRLTDLAAGTYELRVVDANLDHEPTGGLTLRVVSATGAAPTWLRPARRGRPAGRGVDRHGDRS